MLKIEDPFFGGLELLNGFFKRQRFSTAIVGGIVFLPLPLVLFQAIAI